MLKPAIIFFIVFLLGGATCFAQAGKRTKASEDSIFFLKGICKYTGVLFVHNAVLFSEDALGPVSDKIPWLKVHGNILYNFSYRSYSDTPFAQTDLMQHLVQTRLQLLVKNRYPLTVTITNRNSNSSFFQNYTDVNVQFNQQEILNKIKADLIDKTTGRVNLQLLSTAKNDFTMQKAALHNLQDWMNSPARIQEIIEEKERQLSGNYNYVSIQNNIVDNLPDNVNSVNDRSEASGLFSKFKTKSSKWYKASDSLTNRTAGKRKALTDSNQSNVLSKLKAKDSSYISRYNDKKKQYEELKEKLTKTEKRVMQFSKSVQDSISSLKNEINRLRSTDSLYAFMKRNNISKDSFTKAQRILLSINQIGIGRSWLDYSELTVKNISLSGLNVEMNPGRLYLAVAAGKVNYRFRDFIYKRNINQPNQSLYLVRAGLGKKQTNNIIATVYAGNKSVLDYTAGNTATPLQKVIGVSFEGKLLLNKNSYMVAEVAKSSYLVNPVQQPPSSQLLNKVFDLNIHTNEAYCIKLFTQSPATNTKLTAYYRKVGQNFQSFNLLPVSINQDAWMVKLNQALWKKRFMLEAAIRKNDFTSPLSASSFASKTVFKSLLATMRIPKYPFVSVGFYPSSQLFIVNGNTLAESQYNTLNTLVSHSYSFKGVLMNSNAIFTKFYNNSNDTAFIYYNASSYTINHSIFLQPFTLQTSVSVTEQKHLKYFTLEQQVSYQLNQSFSLTAGLKWNRLNHNIDLFGSTAALNLYIKGFGTLQVNYDKTYLPSYSRMLIPVDMGRLSFYKEF